MPAAKAIEDRLRDLSEDRGHCRVWIGHIDKCGYGKINWRGETLAHRASYKVNVGPIPNGLTIDHLCKNRACINPLHLDAVTHAENVARGDYKTTHRNAVKTHCIRGHEFTAENTITEKTPSGTARKCRICTREKNARAAAKRRAR